MRAIILSLVFCFNSALMAGETLQADNLFPKVVFHTSLGDITVELDRSRAPIAVNNFLSYVKTERYNDTIFHRLIADFVLQGGGYASDFEPITTLEAIFNESGNGLKNEIGTIAMARTSNPHSATSQFYFNLSDNENLDPGSRWGYTVFGRVMMGMDILEKVNDWETSHHAVTGWPDVPVEPILLHKVTLQAETELSQE
ncbi:peptidylprolyl isomerase [Alkalimonas collagenimarina]|uniref:Peptidyl-prolyl cis-trans isomerase n=1 Tax=Alkalimonas collagenimarina TaxID=400390 RepID=A0ABT9GYS1_9GAMM|nr:peptidylprolyl isomerase [Alkalimonas collagenimarina]MDP4536206.1 peptidylprolyl isomerase [Alkalimonas collagenimarina]